VAAASPSFSPLILPFDTFISNRKQLRKTVKSTCYVLWIFAGMAPCIRLPFYDRPHHNAPSSRQKAHSHYNHQRLAWRRLFGTSFYSKGTRGKIFTVGMCIDLLQNQLFLYFPTAIPADTGKGRGLQIKVSGPVGLTSMIIVMALIQTAKKAVNDPVGEFAVLRRAF
jgi:hypothetical protein